MDSIQKFTRLLAAGFVIALFMSLSIFAQISFQRTYGGPAFDMAFSARQPSDIDYILAGIVDFLGEGSGDVWLIKTDSLGDTLWTRVYGGSGVDNAKCVHQTLDGGYIMAGETGSYGAGSYDVWLIKTDSMGDSVWTRTYGGSDGDGGYCVQQTPDGGYIICGHTSSYGAGGSDLYLIRTDSMGLVLWDTTCGGGGEERGYWVQQTLDGGYIIVGKTSSFACDLQDLWLVKSDSVGNTLWTKTYDRGGKEGGRCIQLTFDGGYIVAGYTVPSGDSVYNIWLLKMDSSGDTLWTRTYLNNLPISGPGAVSVQQTWDGGYIIAGSVDPLGPDSADVYLIKTDSLGYVVWERSYGDSGVDCGFSVQQTSDSGYVVAGMYSGAFDMSSGDVYLIKTDTQGIVTGVKEQDTFDLPKNFSLSQNYPNPFNPVTEIRYTLPRDSYVKLEVYNIVGQKVTSLVDGKQKAGYKTVWWDAGYLSSGIYFYRLQAGDFVQTKKMVLLR